MSLSLPLLLLTHPHPRPRGPPLFFFVHLSFTESQINSVFDVRRLPARTCRRNSCLAGCADRRARLSADTLHSPRCPHSGTLSRCRPLRLRRSYPVSAEAREAESGKRWRPYPTSPGASSSDPVFSACPRQCHGVGGSLQRGARASLWASRPPASTPREAQTLTRPRSLLSHPHLRASGTPRAVAQATRLRGPVCPQTHSLYLLSSGLRQGRRAGGTRPSSVGGLGAAPWAAGAPTGGGPPWAPHPNISANPHAPGGRRWARDLYFPLIRSWSSLLHFNEELRASGRSEAGALGVTRERPPRS